MDCIILELKETDKLRSLLLSESYITFNQQEAQEFCTELYHLIDVIEDSNIVKIVNIMSAKSNLFQLITVNKLLKDNNYKSSIIITDDIFLTSLKSDGLFLVRYGSKAVTSYERFCMIVDNAAGNRGYLYDAIKNKDYLLRSIREYPRKWAGPDGILWFISSYKRKTHQTIIDNLPYDDEVTRTIPWRKVPNALGIKLSSRISTDECYEVQISYRSYERTYEQEKSIRYLNYTLSGTKYSRILFKFNSFGFRQITYDGMGGYISEILGNLIKYKKVIKQATNYYPKGKFELGPVTQESTERLWKLNFMRSFTYDDNLLILSQCEYIIN